MTRRKFLQIALLSAPFLGQSAWSKSTPFPDLSELEPYEYVGPSNAKVRLIILATGKDYRKLEKEAKSISRKAKVPFNMDGMIYDKKRVWSPGMIRYGQASISAGVTLQSLSTRKSRPTFPSSGRRDIPA